MKEELDKALVKDFPNLFIERNGSIQKSCMPFGFEVGDGWEPIIREASKKLEAIIVAMPEEKRKDYYAFQVKQKFGGLRFYLSTGTEEMYKVTGEVEAKSMKLCEECGEPGAIAGTTWLTCYCPKHREEWEERRRDSAKMKSHVESIKESLKENK